MRRIFRPLATLAIAAFSAMHLPGPALAVGQGTGTAVQELRLYDLDGRMLVVDDREVLGLIGKHEARDNYDIVTAYTRMRPSVPLTSMTIREVLDFQDRVVANGATSSAMGMYQFIRKTLRSTAIKSGIGLDARFDRYTQDRLARFALADCGYYRHDVPDTEIGNCLAAVWASLPVVSGPARGLSRYHNKNGNRALTSVDSVMATVRGRFKDATQERLAEITSRAQGSLQLAPTRPPLEVTILAMAQTLGKTPEEALQDPWLIAMAVGDIPSAIVPPVAHSNMAGMPGYMGGLITRPVQARQPDPRVLAEMERRRKAQRILYGDNAGISSEKLAAH